MLKGQTSRCAGTLLTVALVLFPGPAPAQTKDTSPPVYLNHIYLCLDAETHASLSRDTFLRGFCQFDQATVKAGDGQQWTAIYLTADRTYLEILGPEGVEDGDPGDVGIGFSVERVGSGDAVFKRVKAAFGDMAVKHLQTIKEEDDDRKIIPWYYSFGLRDAKPAPPLRIWLMDVHPEYLNHMSIQIADDNTASRAAYLRSWPGRVYVPGLLADISGITIDVDKKGFDILEKTLLSYGYQRGRLGKSLSFSGPEVKIVANRNELGRGITIHLSLRSRLCEPRELKFGPRSVLRLGTDGSGKWHFFGTN